MFWVGLMLQKQPFYIRGIEKPEQAAQTAYHTAGMFVGCFFISLWYMKCRGRRPDIVSHLQDCQDEEIFAAQMQRHFPTPDYVGESPYIRRARSRGDLRQRRSNSIPPPPAVIELTDSRDSNSPSPPPLSSQQLHQQDQENISNKEADLLGLSSGEFI